MCDLCNDSGWKPVDVGGVTRVTRCDCQRTAFLERAMKAARIPHRYRHCELDNFETPYDSLRQAHRAAQKFVERFPVVDHGLLLYGAYGVGKTHLAVAVLKAVIRKTAARGYFYETAELLKLIRETYSRDSNDTEMDVLRPVLDAELLVLDDLGSSRKSEWVEETLGVLVNARYSERRPTIFTSNLMDSSDITEPESFAAKVGGRVRSRLLEMCDWIRMDSPDVRETGDPNASPDQITRWKRESPFSPDNLGKSRRSLPPRASGQARAKLRDKDGRSELKWSGGKAGS